MISLEIYFLQEYNVLIKIQSSYIPAATYHIKGGIVYV